MTTDDKIAALLVAAAAAALVVPPLVRTRAQTPKVVRVEPHSNASRHVDGSVYVDLASGDVAPGANAVARVKIPHGSVVVADSLEYTGTSTGHFVTVELVDIDDEVTLVARNTGSDVATMTAEFRYRPAVAR